MSYTGAAFPDDDDDRFLAGGNDPWIDAPVEKLRRLRELREELRKREQQFEESRFAQKRKDLLAKYPHPLALAIHLDGSMISTPAIDLISRKWVEALHQKDGRLTISLPPQQGKTVLSRFAIFWALLENPDRRVVFASYGQMLARTSGRAVRNLIEQYGRDYGLTLDNSHRDAADWQLDGFTGGVLSAGVGSSLTGRPSDLMVLDDLLAGQAEANSEVTRVSVNEWWESVARTRMAPGTPAVAIGTRWHEMDILSRFIGEGWNRINIPATAVEGDDTLDSLAGDPAGRTDNGYLISTRGTTEEDWEIIRKESGARAWEALFRGNPTPPEGGIFLRKWFDDHRVAETPELREIVIGVDPAETGLADEAGILVVGRGIDHHLYVMDDLSGMLTQAQWARNACLAWIRHKAHRVVQERTLGSQSSIPQAWSLLRRQAAALKAFETVPAAAEELEKRGDSAAANRDQLRDIYPLVDDIVDAGSHGPRLIVLVPKQSKTVRAETATQPFETGRAHMVGRMERLEFEATHWQAGMPSPNRLDVLSLIINHFGSRGGIIV